MVGSLRLGSEPRLHLLMIRALEISVKLCLLQEPPVFAGCFPFRHFIFTAFLAEF